MADKIIVENVEVMYKGKGMWLKAIEKLNFGVKENEFVSLLGPSGCGKTTTLNVIAGFMKPTKGNVFLNKAIVTKPTKNIGVVFQNNALFPWKTVKENIEIGPKINNAAKKEVLKIRDYYLNLMELAGYSNYYPDELSGGMQQRVGIARALANNPEVILMDEPFGSLDKFTRMRLQEELLSIWLNSRKTILFVTHDIDEALFLSDRILLMSKRPGTIIKEIVNDVKRRYKTELGLDKQYLNQKKRIIESLSF